MLFKQGYLNMQALLLVAFLLGICHGMSVKEDLLFRIKERGVVPTGWRSIGLAPAHHILNLRIALKQGNFEELERRLYEGEY